MTTTSDLQRMPTKELENLLAMITIEKANRDNLREFNKAKDSLLAEIQEFYDVINNIDEHSGEVVFYVKAMDAYASLDLIADAIGNLSLEMFKE